MFLCLNCNSIKCQIIWRNIHHFRSRQVGWLVVLRINVDLAMFQPYLDLEARDYQSLKIQVARPGIEPRSPCSASQELNHSATAVPQIQTGSCCIDCIAVDIVDIDTISFYDCWISCIAIDIDTISSCSCCINCIAVDIVDIVDIDSISTRYHFMIVGSAVLLSISSISIRYRFMITRLLEI